MGRRPLPPYRLPNRFQHVRIIRAIETSLAGEVHKSSLVVGARTFPGNSYDGHLLSAQLEQTNILLEDSGKSPTQVFVDLSYRGVDHENPNVEIIHRGKYRSLTQQQRRCLRRRPAVEPTIGHLKAALRMDRCWLLRAMVCLGLKAFFLRSLWQALLAAISGEQPRRLIRHAPDLTFQVW